MKGLASDDLIVLVTLARNQHEVASSRFRDRLMDRLGPIGDLAVRLTRPLNSLLCITENLFRIFRAWIVRRENHHVAQTARRLAHRRALRPIAIATTAEHRDDLSLHHFTR